MGPMPFTESKYPCLLCENKTDEIHNNETVSTRQTRSRSRKKGPLMWRRVVTQDKKKRSGKLIVPLVIKQRSYKEYRSIFKEERNINDFIMNAYSSFQDEEIDCKIDDIDLSFATSNDIDTTEISGLW